MVKVILIVLLKETARRIQSKRRKDNEIALLQSEANCFAQDSIIGTTSLLDNNNSITPRDNSKAGNDILLG